MRLTRSLTLVALAAVTAAGSAHAGSSALWGRDHAQDATGDGELDLAFGRAMLDGDSALTAGVAETNQMSRLELRRRLDAAMAAYERAGAIRPTSPEPYYRIAMLLETLWSGCKPGQAFCLTLNPMGDNVANQLFVEAVDAMEQRAPMDPRIDALRFERGIAHTKLGTKAHWERARLDYGALMTRGSMRLRGSTGVVAGNLAECEMMLGRTAESVEHYRMAVNATGDTSVVYGLAVALDRDQRGAEARALIGSLGVDNLDRFLRQVVGGTTFFVPAGEVNYYIGQIGRAHV